MLLWEEFCKREHIVCRKFWKECIFFFLGNLRTNINRNIPLKLEFGTMGTQLIVPRCNLRCDGIINCGRHLARRKALPNQCIEAELVSIEIGLDFCRCTGDACRANRLVRVLGLFPGCINIGVCGNIFFSVLFHNVTARFFDC